MPQFLAVTCAPRRTWHHRAAGQAPPQVMTGQARFELPPPILLSRLEHNMPATTRSPQPRPHGAPAYYLGRPASMWITALHTCAPADPEQLAGTGTTLPPERTPRSSA